MFAVVLFAAIACFAAFAFNMVRYSSEQRQVRAWAASIDSLPAGALARANALGMHVRQHVRYRDAPHDDRPFLRATAWETLQSGQGYCGEATRAYIALARAGGIRARRALLYGPQLNHVVPEVEIAPARWILVDIQDNPVTNAFLDATPLTMDDVLRRPGTPFDRVSNLNLQRLPLVGNIVGGIRFKGATLAWIFENPSLILAIMFGGSAMVLAILVVVLRRSMLRGNHDGGVR